MSMFPKRSTPSGHLIKLVYIFYLFVRVDHLCSLVVRIPGYRSRDPGSIPGATDFLKIKGSGTGSTEFSFWFFFLVLLECYIPTPSHSPWSDTRIISLRQL
jgi:hypothetical protein